MGNPSEHMDSTLDEIGALRGFLAEQPPVPSSRTEPSEEERGRPSQGASATVWVRDDDDGLAVVGAGCRVPRCLRFFTYFDD